MGKMKKRRRKEKQKGNKKRRRKQLATATPPRPTNEDNIQMKKAKTGILASRHSKARPHGCSDLVPVASSSSIDGNVREQELLVQSVGPANTRHDGDEGRTVEK